MYVKFRVWAIRYNLFEILKINIVSKIEKHLSKDLTLENRFLY